MPTGKAVGVEAAVAVKMSPFAVAVAQVTYEGVHHTKPVVQAAQEERTEPSPPLP